MAHYLKQYENAMKTYTCGRGLSHFDAPQVSRQFNSKDYVQIRNFARTISL